MTIPEQQIWSVVTEEFGRLRGHQVRELWLEDAEPYSFRRGLFTLDVKDASKKEAIDNCYREDIESIFREITGSHVRLRIRVATSASDPEGASITDGSAAPSDEVLDQDQDQDKAPAVGSKSKDVQAADAEAARRLKRDRRDPVALAGPAEFVRTAANELAAKAVDAFVQSSGRDFNPLFIHGPHGCGKTALAGAALRGLLANDPDCNPLVLSGESLGRDVRRATRARTFGSIQRSWAAHDTIVLDEAHRLRGQQTAQKVAVSLISPILARGGRVLVLSRHAPGMIHGLGDHLRSHFEGGLVVEMLQPDGADRARVLRSVVERLPVQVQSKALEAVAERCPGTLSEAAALLEDSGAAARDRSKKAVGRSPAAVVQLDDVEARLVRVGRGAGSITLLVDMVCEETGLCPDRLRSSEKSRDVAMMRHLCVYLASRSLGLSARQICRSLRLKSPSIVAYARRAVDRRRAADPAYEKLIHVLQARLAGAQRDFEW